MVISADSHANEPVELYERLPEEYRALAPREIIKDGHRYLRIEGAGDMPLDAPNPLSEEDMRRFFRDAEKDQELIASNPSDLAGGIDIPVRLSDLEDDGVSGEVIYPQGIFKSFRLPGRRLPAQRLPAYTMTGTTRYSGSIRTGSSTSALLPMIDIQSADCGGEDG